MSKRANDTTFSAMGIESGKSVPDNPKILILKPVITHSAKLRTAKTESENASWGVCSNEQSFLSSNIRNF